MAYDAATADDTWVRYCYVRDNGHLDYVEKARQCEDFFVGMQWSPGDLALMRQYRRPALTINKIISTLSTVMGEQIYNRMQSTFRPTGKGATQEVADTLTKINKHISDDNHLPWVRSDVFADGIVTSRGFYDVRMDFGDNLKGDVRVTQINPKNVMVDPDAEEYDPDKWGDVIVTKWMNCDTIAMLYSSEAAEELKGRGDTYWPYGYDSIDQDRDRFGTPRTVQYGTQTGSENLVRNVRVIERQHRMLKSVKHFIDLSTGETRMIPDNWDRNRIADALTRVQGVSVTSRIVDRVRWTVVAGHLVLHDDWSPYSRFTVIPYFPHFRRGRTVGLVENLIGPQELLNKSASQELHVVNTTANSGWKVKTGSLTNMSVQELEQKGAMTGLVIEVNEDVNNVEKIQPNQVPSGLDRVAFKAEEHIKGISGISDSMQGFDREDVAAKAINTKRAQGQVNIAKILDNLQRSDFFLTRLVLDMVQSYYTEERVYDVVADRITGETETITINQFDTIAGRIVNDLTLGEYAVVVTSEPERETLEDSQFDQALGLFEKGIPIPPDSIVDASRLRNKAEIVKRMRGDQDSPEAKAAAARKDRMDEATVQNAEAEAMAKQSDAKLKAAKTAKELVETQRAAHEPIGGDGMNQMEQTLEWQKFQREMVQKQKEFDQQMQFERDKFAQEMELKKAESAAKVEIQKQAADDQSLIAAQQAQQKPTKTAGKPAKKGV